MRRWNCLWILLLLRVGETAQGTQEEFERLARDLGNASFEKREEASRKMLDIGKEDPKRYLPLLPLKDPDLEIQSRAVDLRRKILLARGAVEGGILILRGDPMPPPYWIEVEEGQIWVNGKPLQEKPLSKPAAKLPCPHKPIREMPVDPKYVARHEINVKFWKFVREWVQQDDKKPVHEKAIEFWKSEPLVETAKCENGNLVFRWKGERSDEHIELASSIASIRDEERGDPEVRRQEALQSESEALKRVLGNQGTLAIHDRGVEAIIPASVAGEMFAKILAIASPCLEEKERISRLQELFPGVAPDRMAQAMCERLAREEEIARKRGDH